MEEESRYKDGRTGEEAMKGGESERCGHGRGALRRSNAPWRDPTARLGEIIGSVINILSGN